MTAPAVTLAHQPMTNQPAPTNNVLDPVSAINTANDTNTRDIITYDYLAQIRAQQEAAPLPVPLVAVYCGSRVGHAPIYADSARALGEALVAHGYGLVYGGAVIGCMGAVADGVIDHGGVAVGVIPEFMLGREVAHAGLTRLHLTDTMHTRKAIMAEYASAFITLPGGLGTLEEIMEIATWRQLYQHDKPMLILNINGFYDRLIEHLHFTVEQGFMQPADLTRLVMCNTVDDAIAALPPIVKMDDSLDVHKI